jgi:hypothetical protein
MALASSMFPTLTETTATMDRHRLQIEQVAELVHLRVFLQGLENYIL